ncbi:hypothetical protein QA641_11165 [Bradyrhizobium sp. CB1650]|uniref:hypothetical protein n=1 Tax=Bradyrhizobium sp. CB1650 TaxID=3039153 RepID=UPI002435F88B|nr:hypothetical protein [Bradyrhizobium sp. CB1650]WGD54411.1 hypothetical protein QA641_11165 [Bradyrhizobium sp. CB1650]
MSAGWKIFWLSAVVLAVALGLAHLLVPDIVPIGYADAPQPSWAVMTAFVLRAIELTAAFVAITALSILTGVRLRRTFRRAVARAK